MIIIKGDYTKSSGNESYELVVFPMSKINLNEPLCVSGQRQPRTRLAKSHLIKLICKKICVKGESLTLLDAECEAGR